MTKRRPKAGFFDRALRTSLLIVPTLFVFAVVQAQSIGESENGLFQWGSGVLAGPVSVTTSGPGDFFVQSLGSDTGPTSYGTNDVVIGKPVASGASSGAVFIKYNSSTNEGVIGALSPGSAWRAMRVAGTQVYFPNASTIKGTAPGTGSNNFSAASDSKYCFSTTTDASATVDTCISRSGTNTMLVENGSGTAAALSTANITSNGTITSSRTSDFGWSIVSGANTACNTTCTSACVMGFDSVNFIVACTDATADKCLCAGAN